MSGASADGGSGGGGGDSSVDEFRVRDRDSELMAAFKRLPIETERDFSASPLVSAVWYWTVGIDLLAVLVVCGVLLIPYANPFPNDLSVDASQSRSLADHWPYAICISITAAISFAGVLSNVTVALGQTNRSWHHTTKVDSDACGGCCSGCDRQCRLHFVLMLVVYVTSVAFLLIWIPFLGFPRFIGLIQYGASGVVVAVFIAVTLPAAFRQSSTYKRLDAANFLALSFLPILVLFLVAFQSDTAQDSSVLQNVLVIALAIANLLYRFLIHTAFKDSSGFGLRILVPSLWMTALSQSFSNMALPNVRSSGGGGGSGLGTYALVFAIQIAGAVSQPIMLTETYYQIKTRIEQFLYALLCCCCAPTATATVTPATPIASKPPLSPGAIALAATAVIAPVSGASDGGGGDSARISLNPPGSSGAADSAAPELAAGSGGGGSGGSAVESIRDHRLRYAVTGWFTTAGQLLAAVNYIITSLVVMRFGPNRNLFPLNSDRVSDTDYYTSLVFAAMQGCFAFLQLLAFRFGCERWIGVDPARLAYATIRSLRWQYPHAVFVMATFVPFIVMRQTRLIV